MNLRGAVDLSALKARAQRPESAAGSAGPGAPGGAGEGTPSPWVVEGSDARINQLAQLSGQVPVILQLWAGYSDTSLQMLDLMSERVHARGGRLALATIDIDANPQITQAFAVQGVPATFALVKGQPVPLFTGAQPASQIDAFFDELLQVAQANGVTGSLAGGDDEQPGEQQAEAEPALPPLHQEAVDAIDAGDFDRAAAAYRRALAERPADADAAVGLAQVQLLQRLDGVDPDVVRAEAAARPDDLTAQLAVADLDVSGGHVEDAFSRLITFIGSSAGEEKESARARLVELFDVVGTTDPRVTRARSALARVLF